MTDHQPFQCFDLVLDNYRCFRHARLPFRPCMQAVIGLNNVGKSTLIRSIYELRPLFQRLLQSGAFGSSLLPGEFLAPSGSALPLQEVRRDEVYGPRITIEATTNDGVPLSTDGDILTRFTVALNNDGHWKVSLPDFPERDFAISGSMRIHIANQYGRDSFNLRPLLECVRCLAECIYVPALRHVAEGQSAGQRWYDINIGSTFISQLRDLETSGDRADHRRFLRLQTALGNILRVANLQIKPVPNQHRIIVMIGDTSRDLRELGHGISQLIVSSATALVRRPSFLLLDEPEVHLHPTLQVEFLRLLGDHTRHGITFATHAFGLARSAAQQTLVVSRGESGETTVHPLGAATSAFDTLHHLQYNICVPDGMRGALLVEGSTDVLALECWLKTLGLDRQIIMVPLGGSDCINCSSATRAVISQMKRSNALLGVLIDSECDKPETYKRRSAFAEMCKRLGVKCHLTVQPSLEHYLTTRAIKAAFPDCESYSAWRPGKSKPPWGKSQNWKAAKEMTAEEVLATDMGAFLRTL